MEIPFVGGAYLGRSKNLDSQVCQNLYPVADQQGGKKVIALSNTPGLVQWIDLGTGEVRGLHVMGDYLYAVLGNTVYQINGSGTATAMTNTLNTASGHVWMSNNGLQVMIVDQATTYVPSGGYILSGSTLTKISDVDMPVPTSLTYQDGYFIISRESSGKFNISASYDGLDWDALDYGVAEAYSDNIQVVISSQRELWLLGGESYEVWYDSGAAAFPFERISGAVNKVGCGAALSAVEYQGTIIWLDDNRCVRASSGYGANKISTPQIEYQFSTYSTVSDAFAYIYSQEGGIFYVLTFPSEQKTWVYDFSSGYWHTRASGADDKRHRGNCYALFQGMHIVGDYENGKLYKYSLSHYTEDGNKIRRIRAAQSVNGDRKTIFHKSLEVEFEAGVGLISGHDGMNPAEKITNGDMELDSDWSNYPVGLSFWNVRTGAYKRSGSYSRRFQTGFTYTEDIGIYQDISLTAGKKYVIKFYFYIPLNEYNIGFENGIRMKLIDSTGTAIFTSPTEKSREQWNLSESYVEVITTGTYKLVICNAISTLPLDVCIDDVSCKEFIEDIGAKVMLEWSDDGGHVWSNEHWASIGEIGEYKNRAIWRRLGRSRDRIYKVTVSDPVKCVIIGATLEGEPGTS